MEPLKVSGSQLVLEAFLRWRLILLSIRGISDDSLQMTMCRLNALPERIHLK
jgi:hypothetical protein